MNLARRSQRLVPAALLLTALCATPTLAAEDDPQFTENFAVGRCSWSAFGRNNPYFSLQPGDQVTLGGDDDGEFVEVVITVTDETKNIHFVTQGGKEIHLVAREVEERETVDGELKEVSRNWFARCQETGDVYYFGEDVDIYADGQIVSHDGAWQAGVDDSLPGIVMPGTFLLGSRYYQEIAPAAEALDRAENRGANLRFAALGKTFGNCVRIVETSPLEPGHESLKLYCPGVGMVLDNEARLTAYHRG
jgi:hypothetical protein